MQEAYTKAFDEAAKEIRNSLLAVLTLLIESPRFCGSLHASPLLDLLARVATCPDVHTPAAAGLTPLAVAAGPLAHEQLRFVWGMLATGCVNSAACRRRVVEVGFMKVLLMYADVDASEVRSPRDGGWRRAVLALLGWLCQVSAPGPRNQSAVHSTAVLGAAFVLCCHGDRNSRARVCMLDRRIARMRRSIVKPV